MTINCLQNKPLPDQIETIASLVWYVRLEQSFFGAESGGKEEHTEFLRKRYTPYLLRRRMEGLPSRVGSISAAAVGKGHASPVCCAEAEIKHLQ